MSLNEDEVERYARHLVLPEIGGPGQQKLKRARVLVVGAGGLGAPLIQYLAAAGVGHIGIVDDDIVSLSNLQRQTIYGTHDIGAHKAVAAAAFVKRLNPHVVVEEHVTRLAPHNARAMIAFYDVVAEGSDNFATRYAVSDACFHERKPVVMAALGRFDGSLTTIRAHETGVPTCAEAGILGALPGVMGSLMALEVIRAITGFGEPLVGRLLLVDALTMRFETMRYGWDETNALNGITAG
ncbi:MAG: adenylyltransferase [Bosea sp. 32-68-6]|nr:MAG: adenylyltransferase [Bosea sp. 32-68-6]